MAKEYRDVFNVETVLVNYRSEKYGWRRIPFLGQFSGSDGIALSGSLIIFWFLGYTPILWIPDWIINAMSGLFSDGSFSLHIPPTWLSVPLAFGFMFVSRKLEPQGKPMWKYMLDGSWFVARGKATNGWSRIRTAVAKGKKRTRMRASVSIRLTGATSLPAIWRGGGHLQVNVPFRAAVKEHGFELNAQGGHGEPYLPGRYEKQEERLRRL